MLQKFALVHTVTSDYHIEAVNTYVIDALQIYSLTWTLVSDFRYLSSAMRYFLLSVIYKFCPRVFLNGHHLLLLNHINNPRSFNCPLRVSLKSHNFAAISCAWNRLFSDRVKNEIISGSTLL